MVNPGRLEGWEQRLNALIEGARNKPYVLGEHDCFRLACRVIDALTGRDLWPQFCGYTTKRQALNLLAAHGSTFEAAFDRGLGLPRVGIKQARRGDICGLMDDAGEKHLTVLLDHRVACMLPQGLLFIEAARCHCAWRVG
jgi:hypothetical protein